MEREKDLWGRITPLAVFCIVLLLQLVTQLLSKRSKMQLKEVALMKEIKRINREANAVSGPSTFAQAAKMKRVAANKERELAQLRQQPKQKKTYDNIVLLKIVIYCALAWRFWRTPVAKVPAALVQPFANLLSWPSKLSQTEELIKVGILPWLVLCTRVSAYLTNAIFNTKEKAAAVH